MTDKELKPLLERLQAVLEDTDRLDDETRALVRDLDEDIHRLVTPEEETGAEDLALAQEKARELQARFQAEHPVAERFFREIIDVLAKVGI